MILKRGLLTAVALLAVLLALLVSLHRAPAMAPNVSFTLIEGRVMPMSGLRGKTVLVTFWASTCVACRKEMPELSALYRDLSGKGLEIISVAMPYDPPNRVLETRQRMAIPYPVALDIYGDIARAFGNVAVTPSSFLISPDGRIITRHVGRWDFELLRREIRALMAPA